MLDDYAKELDLKRQPIFEEGIKPPWSPNQNK